MQSVQSPIIPVVGELIRRNPGTISLGQGVVHYGPPARATERIEAVLADPVNHRYQLVQGIQPLLEAIESKLAVDNAIALSGNQQIVVTAGGNMAFMNAVLTITDPGDEVILLTPYYFNHEMAITMASCRPVLVATDDEYQPEPDAIERAITPRTRAVVTVSPNNPTGAVYGEAVLRRINGLCRRHGIFHISDEAYEYFTYGDARHFSPGSIEGASDHTISLYSLSKAYGFASWRIGYMVIPDSMLMSVKKAQDTILICPPVVSQAAAVGALEEGRPYCLPFLQGLAEVRELVLHELAGVESFCRVPKTDGAFYFLIRVERDLEPMDLVRDLVERFGVAVIPGTTFGLDEGCYLRIAYGALERETVAEGMGRLVKGLTT